MAWLVEDVQEVAPVNDDKGTLEREGFTARGPRS
jgi:hypothetical protein